MIFIISIHALRGEDDAKQAYQLNNNILFQSTPSVGRTTVLTSKIMNIQSDFNPRPPWGGRHFKAGEVKKMNEISIHALRGEDDVSSPVVAPSKKNFNPRPPWGGRLLNLFPPIRYTGISIHALRGEDDSKNIQICNIVFVHSAYKIIYFCDSCAFYLT